MTANEKIKAFVPFMPDEYFMESNKIEVKGKVSFEASGFCEMSDGGIEYTTAVYAISKKRAKDEEISFTTDDIIGLVTP
jgi:hypothetical protein